MTSAMKRKTAARLAAIQVLYGRDIGNDNGEPVRQVTHILEAYTNQDIGEAAVTPDEKLVQKLVSGATMMLAEVDSYIRQHLSPGWDMERLGAVMRALLRAGVYELLSFSDVPVKVIINEYVSLARAFFSESETGFVNGILDKIAREVRGGQNAEKDTTTV